MKVPKDETPEMLLGEVSGVLFLVSRHYGRIGNSLSEQHIQAIGKRYSMISTSYLAIAQLFYREPDSDEETRDFNIHLNSTYINVFGVLENLAWLIYFERIYSTKKLNKKAINLFGKQFIAVAASCGIDLSGIVHERTTWLAEIKKKRDPIAHQVPLWLHYRVIASPEQMAENDRVTALVNQKASENDLNGWMELSRELKEIGEFFPGIFLVDSEAETISFLNFRSVVNSDLRMLSLIVSDVLKMLYGSS